MENKEITVSIVVTVYNKEPYVAATVRSLLGQEGSHTREYIFVDDVSPDRSVQVIEEVTQGVPNVTIIKNTVNAGPSVRLNQGARLARGKYLQFFDSDDIMAQNASASMLSLLEEHDADLVYGRWKRVHKPGEQVIGTRVAANAPVTVIEQPLDFMLRHSFSHMALMVKRDVFTAAGGCDEGVFIQDESLPVRLAACARRLVILDAPVTLVPLLDGQLSGNTSQLNHDRFLANAHMLQERGGRLDETARRLLYRRCLSAAWKEKRAASPLRSHTSGLFAHYLRSKLQLLPVDAARLAQMRDDFSTLKGVRRV